jgi:mitochondrial import inner membrane translocase subunit TIM17
VPVCASVRAGPFRFMSTQVGGTMFHSFKGARNAPRGERFGGAVEAVKANARRLGGSFAVWGGLFSTFDCCFLALRNKEDPYNSIVSSPTPARATF